MKPLAPSIVPSTPISAALPHAAEPDRANVEALFLALEACGAKPSEAVAGVLAQAPHLFEPVVVFLAGRIRQTEAQLVPERTMGPEIATMDGWTAALTRALDLAALASGLPRAAQELVLACGGRSWGGSPAVALNATRAIAQVALAQGAKWDGQGLASALAKVGIGPLAVALGAFNPWTGYEGKEPPHLAKRLAKRMAVPEDFREWICLQGNDQLALDGVHLDERAQKALAGVVVSRGIGFEGCSGPLPEAMVVTGDFKVYRHAGLRSLNQDLILGGPLSLHACPDLMTIDAVRSVEGLGDRRKISISRCPALERIAMPLLAHDSEVSIQNCPRLERLPETITCGRLEVLDCPRWDGLLPADTRAKTVTLDASRLPRRPKFS